MTNYLTPQRLNEVCFYRGSEVEKQWQHIPKFSYFNYSVLWLSDCVWFAFSPLSNCQSVHASPQFLDVLRNLWICASTGCSCQLSYLYRVRDVALGSRRISFAITYYTRSILKWRWAELGFTSYVLWSGLPIYSVGILCTGIRKDLFYCW